MRDADSPDDEGGRVSDAGPPSERAPRRTSLGPWPSLGDDSEPIAPGTVIADRFRVGRALGRGGHGTVYLAEHLTLGYPVAVKVLHGGFGLDARRRARFRREALLGARLRHRNIVAILDAGELEDGAPFLVMEHVDGIDLESLIERTRLDVAATVETGVQLLAGLTALVERGVIHRDIKPGNVMLQPCVDGFVEVKLLDFGISKALRGEVALETLTADDCVLGTPQYMPPEQVRGESLDARADIYSVGGVLFECVTGEPPFDAETAGSVMARILVERARPVRSLRSDVPEEVAAIIDRALAHDPAERWSHPSEMSEALRAAAQRLGLPRGADAWAVLHPGRAAGRSVGGAGADARTASAPLEDRAAPAGGRAAGDSAEDATARAIELVGLSRRRSVRRAIAAVAAACFAIATVVAATAGDADGGAPAGGPSADVEAWIVTTVASSREARSSEPVALPEAPAASEPVASSELAPSEPAPSELAPSEPSDLEEDTHDGPSAREDRVAATSALRSGARSRAPHAHGRSTVDPARLEALALSAFVAGREREAIGLYERATELAPERASAWRGLGLAAASAGERRSAVRALRRYLALEPSARDRALVERRIARLSQ